MNESGPTRGGARKGAGRKKKPVSEKYVTVTVSLPPRVAAIAQSIGGSNNAKKRVLSAIRRGIILALENPYVIVGH